MAWWLSSIFFFPLGGFYGGHFLWLWLLVVVFGNFLCFFSSWWLFLVVVVGGEFGCGGGKVAIFMWLFSLWFLVLVVVAIGMDWWWVFLQFFCFGIVVICWGGWWCSSDLGPCYGWLLLGRGWVSDCCLVEEVVGVWVCSRWRERETREEGRERKLERGDFFFGYIF